jgi:alpha-tubulin suppressor-like RCC1 family protein
VIERVSPASLIPKAVSVGPGFACIRSHSTVAFRPDVLQCFGNGQFGELGNGQNVSAASPQTVARDSIDPFHLNLHFACGVQLSVVFCWGANSSGQLGNGTMMNSNVPVSVSLPGFSAVSVGVGFNHACAVDASGAMFCWGDDSAGQLGNGTTSSPLLPLTMPVLVASGWKLP